MRRRTAMAVTGLAAGLMLCLTAPIPTAEALPAKEYRVQETTPCMSWQGCPRMLRNAVSYAEQFCQAEGGVLKGTQKGDFHCEQRGIYCVVTGRIECNGRFDPTRLPGAPGEARSIVRPEKTCLDPDCRRFVSHAPGEQTLGTHACPVGHLLAGVSGTGNNLVCQALAAAEQEMRIQREVRRDGLLVCPSGMLARGVDEDRSMLLCVRVPARVSDDRAQDESDNLGLQVCTDEEGEYAPDRFVRGVDPARARLVCSTVTPR